MFQINQTINLRAENQIKVYEQVLVAGNRNAHTWRVTVMDGESAATLDGCTAMLFVTRMDGKTVATTDRITISANTASAALPADAYEVEGAVLIELELYRGSDTITCAQMGARVVKRRNGQIVVPGQGEIYDLNTLLGEIAAMREATKSANTAASSANTAASSANTAASSANTAASSANTAAGTANAAAARLDGLTATATGLDAGSAPTVDVTTGEDGAKRLAFGIPKGDKGDTGATPKLAITVKTGEPGTEASAVQGGTPENPTLEITIPRGNTGDIGALTVNGQAPDASGAVTLTPEDLGAATAEDVSQLRGMIGPFMFRYDAEDGHLYMDYDNGYDAEKWSVNADGHLIYTF